jgi:hypothetical protein
MIERVRSTAMICLVQAGSDRVCSMVQLSAYSPLNVPEQARREAKTPAAGEYVAGVFAGLSAL